MTLCVYLKTPDRGWYLLYYL